MFRSSWSSESGLVLFSRRLAFWTGELLGNVGFLSWLSARVRSSEGLEVWRYGVPAMVE